MVKSGGAAALVSVLYTPLRFGAQFRVHYLYRALPRGNESRDSNFRTSPPFIRPAYVADAHEASFAYSIPLIVSESKLFVASPSVQQLLTEGGN